MIKTLKSNQIFVFGSNMAGIHAGGAARQAQKDFGAKDGAGEGLWGRSYAFPTLKANFKKRLRRQLRESRDMLFACAAKHPDKEFLLTKVGCGIAGFNEKYIKSLFVNPPKNLILPLEWQAK